MKFRKKLVLAGAIIGSIGVGSAAYAYFTAPANSQDGSASAGSSQAVTIRQIGAVGNLYPGGAAQTIQFAIDNPVAGQVVPNVKVSLAGTSNPLCVALDNFDLVTDTSPVGALALNTTEFTSDGAHLSLLKIQMKETGAPQDDCQEATVTLHFTVAP